ncbi:MAG: hypothetical protein AMQ22_00585 [Candidatus Methanofastidiosum methylothiophilum]|uniref:Uncharacterized protein n=1 Tax=Candidatus Methanofastidiosum methylothiophilum TaxID=1705564 RepID=A0A150J762_9EURY|nr:MAG: hypothetical protein AMQ22_00585 [Candidatus Methanofastidiosum methylthiophilus]
MHPIKTECRKKVLRMENNNLPHIIKSLGKIADVVELISTKTISHDEQLKYLSSKIEKLERENERLWEVFNSNCNR